MLKGLKGNIYFMYRYFIFKVKKYIKRSIFYVFFLSIKDYLVIPRNSTIIIHIGKTGGSSLFKSLKLLNLFHEYKVVHVRKVIYRKDLKYIILIRNPINRAISAFNYRYKNLVILKRNEDRFFNEKIILEKYKSLNNLAENLYFKNGQLRRKVSEEFKSIHHLNEDINFYLKDLLKKCSSKQILSVIAQENLYEDVLKTFNIKCYENEKVSDASLNKVHLKDIAIYNLRKYLKKDYIQIQKLYSMGKISNKNYQRLIS